MRLRRPASSKASKATILLIVAVTICCWTNAMGALAAKGIDHGLLDGITVAVVALLGAGGGVGWMSKHRSRKTAPKPADETSQGPTDGIAGATETAQLPPTSKGTHTEPSADPIERACRELARTHDLSLRERDVLYLMATGITGKEIAARLTLSYNTVKSHIRHIYDKLDVHRKQDLVDLIAKETERLS
ncbi:response regulator transcription factor [uncultured Senegalimassilia sp.]|uniref:response regulator transcription factor n=1 Tax=uncultured Senegalimassilia sp. TaxID=1714350 RepID=UPI0025CE88FA|nr:LuxR family transcriptional regulator [uncultured Senegalimassilia sp.]